MTAVLNPIGQPIGSVYIDQTAPEADVTPTDFGRSVGNVLRYGADPTGAASSTSAFQAAADVGALQTNAGYVIAVPAGTYKITETITCQGRIMFRGDGINATRINCATGVGFLKIQNSAATHEIEGGGCADMTISHDAADIVIECVDVWGLLFDRLFFRDGGTGSGSLIKASGECFELRLRDSRLVGANDFGVNLIDDCNSCIVEGNDFALNNGCTAVRGKDLSDLVIEKNRFEYAGSDAGTKIELENALNTVIAANHLEAASSGFAIVQKGTSAGTKVTDNAFAVSGTGAVIDVQAGTTPYYSNNYGYRTRNKGSGAIADGDTSVTITHGLDVTPTAGDISVTPTGDPTNTPGNIWIDTITSSQFNVNCENDPGASTLTFHWRADVIS